MPSLHSIFISYRRSDSNDVVGRIYDRLREYFGQDVVFKDVDSIPYGDDFRSHLVQTVSQCQVLIAVIGPTWLKALQARLTQADQQDWVRAEIETALKKETAIPVIPLLVSGASMPDETELPAGLIPLAHRNAAQARPDPDFHTDLDRLILRLEEIVGAPEPAIQAQSDGSSAGSSEKLEPVVTEMAKPSEQTSQSQSIGNITISGSHNPFNAVQAGGSVNIRQTQSQTTETNSDLQAVLDAIANLKQAVTANDQLDEMDKEMAAIPIKKLEVELQKPQPDRGAVDKAIAMLMKALDGATALAEPVTKIAALVTKAWMSLP